MLFFGNFFWKLLPIVTNWQMKKNKRNIMPKMSGTWLRFGFQLPKDQLLEHFICSEHNSWQAIDIWRRIHFLGKDWCTGYRAPSPSLHYDFLGYYLKQHQQHQSVRDQSELEPGQSSPARKLPDFLSMCIATAEDSPVLKRVPDGHGQFFRSGQWKIKGNI